MYCARQPIRFCHVGTVQPIKALRQEGKLDGPAEEKRWRWRGRWKRKTETYAGNFILPRVTVAGKASQVCVEGFCNLSAAVLRTNKPPGTSHICRLYVNKNKTKQTNLNTKRKINHFYWVVYVLETNLNRKSPFSPSLPPSSSDLPSPHVKTVLHTDFRPASAFLLLRISRRAAEMTGG